MSNRKLLVFALMAALAAAAPLAADEGKIPVYGQGSLTEPGHYILTRDINITSGHGIGIANTAGNLVLDLNGHTIKSTSTSGYLIVLTSGATHVTIRNGRLVGGQNAIRYYSTSSRVHLVVENVEIVDPTDYGVYVYGAEHVEVTGCRFRGDAYGQSAILVDGYSKAFTGRFNNNTISRPGDYGIYLDGLTTGDVSNNTIQNFATGTVAISAGIYLDCTASWSCKSNRVAGNRIQPTNSGFHSEDGIAMFRTHGCIIENNTCRTGYDDLKLTDCDDNLIIENTFGDVEIVSGEGNLVENNRLYWLDMGPVSDPRNVYRNNYVTQYIVGSGLNGGGNITSP